MLTGETTDSRPPAYSRNTCLLPELARPMSRRAHASAQYKRLRQSAQDGHKRWIEKAACFTCALPNRRKFGGLEPGTSFRHAMSLQLALLAACALLAATSGKSAEQRAFILLLTFGI